MRIKVIGSAAGGGFPQWNCNAPLSRAVRMGAQGFRSRTQSSIAVSSGGAHWALFNASPDIRQQIGENPELSPAVDAPLRSTPIACVVLTNADVDHIAGLLTLRERQPFSLYATQRVMDVIHANPIFRVLNPDLVKRKLLPLDEVTMLEGPDGPIGIEIQAFAVDGKVALFMEEEGQAEGNFGTEEGDTIGVAIRQHCDAAPVYYIPGCAQVSDELRARINGAACLLFDGTVYTDDEMRLAGVGEKSGSRMGHIYMSGKDGSMDRLADVELGQRIFIHINNTNPVLEAGSPAERDVIDRGWKIAYDGMEIVL